MIRAVSVKFGTVEIVSELYSDHEEADARIFLHLHHTVMNYGVGHVILLWSCDSDVAAMCPRYVHYLGIRELFFKTGTGKKKRYVPMHIVAKNLGPDMSCVLPAIQALSGCHLPSAFFGIGKQKKRIVSLRENTDLYSS